MKCWMPPVVLADSSGVLPNVPSVAYSPSIPLQRWTGPRRASILTLAQAHAAMGEVDGPGRPRELGRPRWHAYILRVVAEFHAFVRDLHHLAAERMVEQTHPGPQYRPLLVGAVTEGRLIDRGNAAVRSIEQDFRRPTPWDRPNCAGTRPPRVGSYFPVLRDRTVVTTWHKTRGWNSGSGAVGPWPRGPRHNPRGVGRSCRPLLSATGLR